MYLATVAGGGGKGVVWMAGEGGGDGGPAEAPKAWGSSALPDFPAPSALQGSGWKPRPDDARPWIVIDSIEPRTLGGLIVDWLEHAPASGFRVRSSNSGVRWQTVYAATEAGGQRRHVYLPGFKTRLLRLEIDEPSAAAPLPGHTLHSCGS